MCVCVVICVALMCGNLFIYSQLVCGCVLEIVSCNFVNTILLSQELLALVYDVILSKAAGDFNSERSLPAKSKYQIKRSEFMKAMDVCDWHSLKSEMSEVQVGT